MPNYCCQSAECLYISYSVLLLILNNGFFLSKSFLHLISDCVTNNHSYPSVFNSCVIHMHGLIAGLLHWHDNLYRVASRCFQATIHMHACVKGLCGLKKATTK